MLHALRNADSGILKRMVSIRITGSSGNLKVEEKVKTHSEKFSFMAVAANGDDSSPKGDVMKQRK